MVKKTERNRAALRAVRLEQVSLLVDMVAQTSAPAHFESVQPPERPARPCGRAGGLTSDGHMKPTLAQTRARTAYRARVAASMRTGARDTRRTRTVAQIAARWQLVNEQDKLSVSFERYAEDVKSRSGPTAASTRARPTHATLRCGEVIAQFELYNSDPTKYMRQSDLGWGVAV